MLPPCEAVLVIEKEKRLLVEGCSAPYEVIFFIGGNSAMLVGV